MKTETNYKWSISDEELKIQKLVDYHEGPVVIEQETVVPKEASIEAYNAWIKGNTQTQNYNQEYWESEEQQCLK